MARLQMFVILVCCFRFVLSSEKCNRFLPPKCPMIFHRGEFIPREPKSVQFITYRGCNSTTRGHRHAYICVAANSTAIHTVNYDQLTSTTDMPLWQTSSSQTKISEKPILMSTQRPPVSTNAVAYVGSSVSTTVVKDRLGKTAHADVSEILKTAQSTREPRQTTHSSTPAVSTSQRTLITATTISTSKPTVAATPSTTPTASDTPMTSLTTLSPVTHGRNIPSGLMSSTRTTSQIAALISASSTPTPLKPEEPSTRSSNIQTPSPHKSFSRTTSQATKSATSVSKTTMSDGKSGMAPPASMSTSSQAVTPSDLLTDELTSMSRTTNSSILQTASTTSTPSSATEPDPKIFVIDTERRAIYVSDLITMNFSRLPITTNSPPWDLAYDRTDRKLYWSEKAYRQIWRANLDGTNKELIANTSTGTGRIRISIAEKSRRIYYTTKYPNSIQSFSLNANESKDIIIGTNECLPQALAVAEPLRYLYWTCEQHIMRCRLDGTNITSLYFHQEWFNILSLDIDMTEERLIFADRQVSVVGYMDLRNGNVSILTNSSSRPYDVGGHNGALYWTDKNIKGIVSTHDVTKNSTAARYHAIDFFENVGNMYIAEI